MKLRTTLCLAAAPLLLTACSSTSTPTTSASLDASGVVTKLKSAGLPIGTVTVYTASTDPNHLLGRPNGYESKAAFTDTRVKASDAHDSSAGSVDLGGSVEVFGTNSDAVARQNYIQSIGKNIPMLGTEYDYVSGDVLLRVSEVLTPDQAKAYQSALTG